MYMLAILKKKIKYSGNLFLDPHHFSISIIEMDSALFYKFKYHSVGSHFRRTTVCALLNSISSGCF